VDGAHDSKGNIAVIALGSGLVAVVLTVWAAVSLRTQQPRLLRAGVSQPEKEVRPPKTQLLSRSVLWLRWQRRLLQRKRQNEAYRELPLVVDLLRLCIGSGMSVFGALDAVSRHTDGVIAEAFAGVVVKVEHGARTSDALDEVALHLGNPVHNLIWCLTSSERYGSPLSDSLARLSKESRLDQERRSEQAARRLTVQLLFPVAGCSLPAFALLTVVPMIAGSLTTLASTFN